MCPYEKDIIAQNTDALFLLFSNKIPAQKAELAKKFINDFVNSIVPDVCDYLYDIEVPANKLFEEVGKVVGSIYSVLEKKLVKSFTKSNTYFFVFSNNTKILDNTFEHPPLPSKNDVKKKLEEYVIIFKKNNLQSLGMIAYNDVINNAQFGTVWANTLKDASFYLSLDTGLATVVLQVIKGEPVKEYYVPYEMIGVDSKNKKIKYIALLTPFGIMDWVVMSNV